MRVHIPNLPHTETIRDWATCAYTQRNRRLPGMLRAYGHDVFLYGGERNEADVTEHVPVVTAEDRRRWFGDETYVDKVFDQWDPSSPCWTEMNDAVIAAIRQRIEPHDIIGLTMGRCQDQIGQAFPNHVRAEIGVGYVGVLPYTVRCFESHSHQSYVHGYYQEDCGHFFDTVISNFFDPDEFTFTDTPDDYLLFIGRPSADKGIGIVAELAKQFRVVTAGQGPPRLDGVEHRGIVRGEEKAELFAHARAVLVPTMYREPFGGVSIEALMSGVPAITTDFGAFVENISQGVDGFRCNTLAEFIGACTDDDKLDRHNIRHRARARFSVDAVAPQYARWLERCETLYGDGWYEGTRAVA